AEPTLFYDPACGNIVVSNDLGYTALFFSLGSTSANLHAPAPGVLPGADVDEGDLPYYLTWLWVPAGLFDVGGIVTPGTPIEDLSFRYQRQFIGAPGDWSQLGPIKLQPHPCPEPTAAVLMGIAMAVGALCCRVRSYVTR